MLWFMRRSLAKMNYKIVLQTCFCWSFVVFFLRIERRRRRKKFMVFFENIDRIHDALFIAGAIRLRSIFPMIWSVKFTWAPSHAKKAKYFILLLLFSTHWLRRERKKSYGFALRAWFCQVVRGVSFQKVFDCLLRLSIFYCWASNMRHEHIVPCAK